MDRDQAADVAYHCHRVLDPLHSLIYFVPEGDQRLAEVGLRPGRMCYFASRSAPMGKVGPGTVAATFFNFNPELVVRHIPRAWTLAEPERIVAARFDAADAALRRLLGDEVIGSARLREAADLAARAAGACSAEGRPLYAAHADLEWPQEPHLVLWHAASLLREFRGDGHIAALVGAGLDGLSALVTHTATGRGFLESAAKSTRGWSDEQWEHAVTQLREAGLLDESGVLTGEGVRLREEVESATNRSAATPWARLGDEDAGRLRELARELSKAVVAAGAFPDGVFATPKA